MNFTFGDWLYFTTAFGALVFFGTIIGLSAGFTPLAAILLATMSGGALVVATFIIVMWIAYFEAAIAERRANK